MGVMRNGVYKVYNGTDFDQINLVTVASNVSITDSNNRITATNVEDALQELAGSGRTTETIKDAYDKIGVLSTLNTTNKSSAVDAINEINTTVVTHLAEKASQSALGHVKVDAFTITADANGVISASEEFQKTRIRMYMGV